MAGEGFRSVLIPRRERVEIETVKPTFKSVGIIGVGLTGELYLKQISSALSDVVSITGIIRQLDQKSDALTKRYPTASFSGIDEIRDILQSDERRPEAIILATPNPVDDLLQEIAANLGDKPLTLILPQNGVGVAEKAREILGKNVTIIRANLFTPVSTNEDGSIKYDSDKLRIGLALMPEADNTVFDARGNEELQKAKALFEQSGFDAKVFEDYKAMEWTKLLLNSIGSTSEVTGLTPEETFSDPKLRKIELQAIADRLKIMRAAGIKYEKIHWGGAQMLPLLDKPIIKQLRNHWPLAGFITDLIASGRENKPSASGIRILNGAMPDETEIPYYHQPFIDLAKEHGLSSPVDEAITGIMDRYPKKIDLMHMAPKDKRAILFSNARRKKSITEKIAGSDWFAKLSRDILLKTVLTEIVNPENIDKAREILKIGSLLVIVNHVDKLDAIPLAKPIRKIVPLDEHALSVFIADKHSNEERVPLEGALMNGWARTTGFDFSPMVQVDDHFHSNAEARRINVGSIVGALRKLKRIGQVIGMAIEGTRSDTGGLLEAQDGVGTILEAVGENVWVLPITIVHGPIAPIITHSTVIVGEPYNCHEKVLECKEAGVPLVESVMLDMASYLPEENRGYYWRPFKIKVN